MVSVEREKEGCAAHPSWPRRLQYHLSLKEIVAQSKTAVEREVLSKTLLQTGGNKAKAARLLQVDYKTVRTKIKQYGINLKENTL